MIRPLMNAWDTVSGIGGSRMAAETRDAYLDAADCFVPMDEMRRAAGRKLAQITRRPAACLTGGVAAGLMAAACLLRAPGRCRMVLQTPHMNPYAAAVAGGGTPLLLADADEEAIGRALDREGCGLLFAAADKYAARGVPLSACIRIAHSRGLPVLVDAAAQLPPVANLWEIPGDMVFFSGGKALAGPQSCGFAVGEEMWIDGLARCMEGDAPARWTLPGRESAMALMTAAERFVLGGCAKRSEDAGRCARRLADALGGAYAVTFRPVTPLGQALPALLLTPRREAAEDVRRRLKARGIMIGMEGERLTLQPWGLCEAEEAPLLEALLHPQEGRDMHGENRTTAG